MEELRKDIPWYEWLYQVSNLWRVKSLWNNKTRKYKILRWFNKVWYSYVELYKDTISVNFKISRLVSQAFLWLDMNDKKLCACHIDDNGLNNRVDNLFVWTYKDNTQDMIKKWRQKFGGGRENIFGGKRRENPKGNVLYSKITRQQVKEIKNLYRWWLSRNEKQDIADKYGVSLTHICHIMYNTSKPYKDL